MQFFKIYTDFIWPKSSGQKHRQDSIVTAQRLLHPSFYSIWTFNINFNTQVLYDPVFKISSMEF